MKQYVHDDMIIIIEFNLTNIILPSSEIFIKLSFHFITQDNQDITRAIIQLLPIIIP